MPTSLADAVASIKMIKDIIFPWFGVQVLITDGGTHFMEGTFQKTLHKYGVNPWVATPYHPNVIILFKTYSLVCFYYGTGGRYGHTGPYWWSLNLLETFLFSLIFASFWYDRVVRSFFTIPMVVKLIGNFRCFFIFLSFWYDRVVRAHIRWSLNL
jgi:hypothetical protein